MKVERVEPALSSSALTGDSDAELSGFIMQGFHSVREDDYVTPHLSRLHIFFWQAVPV